MEFNFDEVQEMSDPIKPDIWYEATIEEVSEEVSNAGNPCWKMVWSLNAQDSTIIDRLYFTPKAMPRVKLLFGCLGLKSTGKINVEPDALQDRNCEIYIIEEEYDGKKKLRISWNGFRKDGMEEEAQEVPF